MIHVSDSQDSQDTGISTETKDYIPKPKNGVKISIWDISDETNTRKQGSILNSTVPLTTV